MIRKKDIGERTGRVSVIYSVLKESWRRICESCMFVILCLNPSENESVSSPMTRSMSSTSASTADPNDRRSTNNERNGEQAFHLSKNLYFILEIDLYRENAACLQLNYQSISTSRS